MSNAAVPGAYVRDLDRGAANHVALSPLSFLERSALVYPDKIAVIHGSRRYSYRELRARCGRLAAEDEHLRALGHGL